MRKSIMSLLPVLAMAAWLPVQAQGTEQSRANASIAGKAAAAKAAPASPPAKATAATADRKRQFTAGAVPAAALSTSPTASPAASPSTPALTKDKSHCHSSGSEA